MERLDFEYDIKLFEKDFRKAEIGFRKAKEYFFGCVEHWQRFSDSRLETHVKLVASPEDNQVTGELFGKKFAMQLSQISISDEGHAVIRLSVTDASTGRPNEVDRFYVNVSGNVVSKDQVVLLDSQDDMPSIKLFFAIIRRVLQAEPWA